MLVVSIPMAREQLIAVAAPTQDQVSKGPLLSSIVVTRVSLQAKRVWPIPSISVSKGVLLET